MSWMRCVHAGCTLLTRVNCQLDLDITCSGIYTACNVNYDSGNISFQMWLNYFRAIVVLTNICGCCKKQPFHYESQHVMTVAPDHP